jgi:phosphotriesterase-related protein
MMNDERSMLSRRDVMRALGTGLAAGVFSTWGDDAELIAAVLQGAATARVTFPRGAVIRTILRDVAPDELGSRVTLFHEHLSIKLPPERPLPPDAAPRPVPTDDVDFIVQEIKTAGQEGIGCIVDGGHPDMGRDLNTLKRVANETSVHVVASGGYYMQRTYPPDIAKWSEDQIADRLVQEATRDRLGAFGEIGQAANGASMTADERKVFRAVGKAHVRTGLPIFTHNAYGTGPDVPMDAGLRQLDVLESAGVQPRNVAIGHVCCLDDRSAAIPKQIAKRGAFVGFDRVTGGRVPDAQKVATILAFLEAGYADKLLVCSDYTGSRSPQRPGYGNTVTVFAPLLQKAGVKDEVVRTILRDNPRRLLACVPKV